MPGKNEISGIVPFEVAIDKTGFGLYNYLLTSLSGLVIIAYGFIAFSSTIIVPASACELETTSTQQGLLASAPIVALIVGSVAWGYLADQHGRRSMLLASLLGGAIINAVASISVNWVMLLVVQFIATLLAAGQYTLAMTILGESVPTAKRNLVMLMVTSIFMLAQGIMAVLAIPIIPLTFSFHLPALGIYWNSWRTLLVVYSAPSLICALWMYFMKESPKYTLAKGDEAQTLEILTFMHKMNNRKSAEEFQVKGILADASSGQQASSSGSQVLLLFKMPLLKYTVIMSMLAVFHQLAAFVIWLPTIADQLVTLLETGEGTDMTLCQILNADVEILVDENTTPCALNISALLIVLIVGVAQSAANILVSLVVNYTGRRNIAMAIAAFCGISGILVNLMPTAIPSVIFFGFMLLGMMLLGLYTAISVALFPTNLRALAVALTMSCGRVGNFASVQILNFLLVSNCEVGFYVFASLFASSAIVASFLPDDRLLQTQKRSTSIEEQNEAELEDSSK